MCNMHCGCKFVDCKITVQPEAKQVKIHKYTKDLEQKVINGVIAKLPFAIQDDVRIALGRHKIVYTSQNEYTIVMLVPKGRFNTTSKNFWIVPGVTRKHRDDTNNPTHAKALALSRALKFLADRVEAKVMDKDY